MLPLFGAGYICKEVKWLLHYRSPGLAHRQNNHFRRQECKRHNYIRMEENMRTNYLMGELSKRLNVPPYRIAYLLTTRQLPEPKRVGNRRVFTETDARQVAKALGISWEACTEPQEAHE